jgi:hypothetical protein
MIALRWSLLRIAAAVVCATAAVGRVITMQPATMEHACSPAVCIISPPTGSVERTAASAPTVLVNLVLAVEACVGVPGAPFHPEELAIELHEEHDSLPLQWSMGLQAWDEQPVAAHFTPGSFVLTLRLVHSKPLSRAARAGGSGTAGLAGGCRNWSAFWWGRQGRQNNTGFSHDRVHCRGRRSAIGVGGLARTG